MASAIDKVQIRLQEAMDQGNQASLGQAIDASKGVNGLKQLRRSAKARLKQLSADQNRNMIGSHAPSEEPPLKWRTSEQGGRYRAVAHLPTSIIGWVIGHKGCNARMLKQQTGTELWVDVPGQCVIVEARAVQEVEGAMDAVNGFVKTAPTFIAKIQAGGGGGVTQTVQCPVHLLPAIQRLSRKIQAESGASCVFANCKMSTFCVTGEKKNVDAAVVMLNRLIAEGNSETLANGGVNNSNNGNHNSHSHSHGHMGGGGSGNGNNSVISNGHHPDRRGPGVGSVGGMRGPMTGGDLGHRLGRMGSDMSRSDGSPATAPCSPETASTVNAWGNGAPSQLRSWNIPSAAAAAPNTAKMTPPSTTMTTPPTAATMTTITMLSGSQGPSPLSSQHHHHQQQQQQSRSHCPGSAPPTPGGPAAAPFQGGSAVGGGVGASSDLSFFSFSGVGGGCSAVGGAGALAPRASTAPAAGGGGGGGLCGVGTTSANTSINLPGLGFLEESAGAGSRLGYEHDFEDELRASSCGSGEYGGQEAQGFPTHSRRPGSVGSIGVGSGSGGGGVSTGASGGGGEGSGCPLEGTIEELLEELGLAKYLPVFQSAEVDLPTLCIMSEDDFRELGILKGPRVKIMHHIGSR